MSSEAIDIVALEALLMRQPRPSRDEAPADIETEHPLAQKLRTVLANPGAHQVGDLARVIECLSKEMAMLKAAHGLTDEPGN